MPEMFLVFLIAIAIAAPSVAGMFLVCTKKKRVVRFYIEGPNARINVVNCKDSHNEDESERVYFNPKDYR